MLHTFLFEGIWFQSSCGFNGKDCRIGSCRKRKDEGKICPIFFMHIPKLVINVCNKFLRSILG